MPRPSDYLFFKSLCWAPRSRPALRSLNPATQGRAWGLLRGTHSVLGVLFVQGCGLQEPPPRGLAGQVTAVQGQIRLLSGLEWRGHRGVITRLSPNPATGGAASWELPA